MINLKKVEILDDFVHNEYYTIKYDGRAWIVIFKDHRDRECHEDFTFVDYNNGLTWGYSSKEIESIITNHSIHRIIIDSEKLYLVESL